MNNLTLIFHAVHRKVCRTLKLSFLLMALAISLQATSLKAAQVEGKITNVRGVPIKAATVIVHSAAPIKGVGSFCPTCYEDCGKKATTDEQGDFIIDGLDSSLKFKLLVVGKNHWPKISKHVAPQRLSLEDHGLTIMLTPLPEKIEEGRFLRGRVLGHNGEPVAGAEIRPHGAKQGDRRWWGRLDSVSPIAISDQHGKFLISFGVGMEALDLKLTAPAHAPQNFTMVPLNAGVQELKLERGASVVGQVLGEGKPVDGLVVVLSHTNRSSGDFLGTQEIATDSSGRFNFSNIATGQDYYLHAKMSPKSPAGSLPLTRIELIKDTKRFDADVLELGPSHRLAGRVVLVDGGKLPANRQMILSRTGAWDSQRYVLDDDGQFEFLDVPNGEPVTISYRLPGYRLVQPLTRFQRVRDGSVGIYVETDRDNVNLFYEPEK